MDTIRPVGTPKEEALRHYGQRAAEFETLNQAAGGEIPAIILDGLHYIEIDVVSILEAAAVAELRDPIPQCAAIIYDTGNLNHCVLQWHHHGAHVAI